MAIAVGAGIFLSPYLIHKLGNEGYGVWVLAFGLIENYWLFDLGLRSATVKYSAEYRATNDFDRINEVINTGVAFFAVLATLLMAGTWIISYYIDRLFNVSPALHSEFRFLVVIIGASWSLGMIFNIFNATLEGFQRFDMSSRIWIAVTAVRVAGTAVLLFLGFGLIALGILVVAAQMFGYVLSFVSVRRVFPAQRFSAALASIRMLKQLVGYGVHTLTGTVAMQMLNQSAPLMIGHFRPAAFVGYYSVPVRLLQYAGDAVSRVALVTTSNASELQAREEYSAIPRLGILVNRYCLVLIMPVALFLTLYGAELIRVWIRDPAYVKMSAPLIPILVLGALFAIAGQFNSSAILFGLARHKNYTRALLAEGLVLAAGLSFVVPRYGIIGAAWITTILMIAVRGVYTPWLVCRGLNFSYREYMRAIYLRPLLTAAPVLGAAWWAKNTFLPGSTLAQVITAAAAIAAVYYAMAAMTVVERPHRGLVVNMVARRVRAKAA